MSQIMRTFSVIEILQFTSSRGGKEGYTLKKNTKKYGIKLTPTNNYMLLKHWRYEEM